MKNQMTSGEKRKLILDAKVDILKILESGRKSLVWVKDRDAVISMLKEIHDEYKKL